MKTLTIILAFLITGCASHWQPDYAVSKDTAHEIVNRKVAAQLERYQSVMLWGERSAIVVVSVNSQGEVTKATIRGDYSFGSHIIDNLQPFPKHKGEEMHYEIPLSVQKWQ